MQTANELEQQPIRILLVDDHKSMLWGLERLIESEHPRMNVVGKASSRAELFAVLASALPDIVLLDLDLNGENGLDFMEDILKQSKAQVLVLTAMQDPAVHQRAIVIGASGVVLKSDNAEVILRAIQRVYEGEVWLNRSMTSRMLKGMSTHPSPEDSLHAKKIATLTPKELQIIAAMAAKPGAHNKAVASQLAMSEHTLRNHLTEIYAKLELENRLELVMFAIDHKLVAH